VAKKTYQTSELLEVTALLGELMDAGLRHWAAVVQIYEAAKGCRLIWIIDEPAIAEGLFATKGSQVEIDAFLQSLAKDAMAFNREFIEKRHPFKRHCFTLESVREVFPKLARFNHDGSSPTDTPAAVQAPPDKSKLPPLPKSRHGELREYLATLPAANGAEKKATEHFGCRVTRTLTRSIMDELLGANRVGRTKKAK
jgi:hypothetical protein